MIILVNDASILIDLLKTNLMLPFLDLAYEFHVTDFVTREVLEENVDQLVALIKDQKLIKRIFTYEELVQIQQLEQAHKGLSVPDCSCLYFAKTLAATLLTGDAALRRIARQNKIPVHGLLWVFDELVTHNLITRQTASRKLSELVTVNFRLPTRECNNRLTKWGKGK